MLAQTPPRGYNTWNTFGENINEQLIFETADAMVKLGLPEYGYNYLVIDDCWSERTRDPETGKIIPDRKKFPHGMKAVSDYVHSKGLKFGMYSCAGIRTCADYPGSFGHEYLDAQTFAEYGCDFLKYDFCYMPKADGPLCYRKMGMALRTCGREILFSACNWGSDDVNRWIRSAGAHMYRSTGDIFDNFKSFSDIFRSQLQNFGFSAPGCWNDIDMLTVGMYGKGNVGTSGCDDTDYRTQFVLWCLASSPLMLGCDVRTMNEQTLKLVTNPELLAIHADPEARPPYVMTRAPWCEDSVAIMKLLSNGEFALGFFNFSENDRNVPAYLRDGGIDSEVFDTYLTDVFTGEQLGPYRDYINFSIQKHGCRLFRGKLVKRA